MKFVRIKAGTFTMGSPAAEAGRYGDEAQHEVTISKDFYLGVYEVTQAEYRAITGKSPSEFKGDDRPVEQVSWEEAVAFAEALSERDGQRYRLPTEAEWEWACRAGTTTRYWSGDGDADLARVGWYDGKSGGETHAVGSKGAANPWGLHDMQGNVWEWCSDWYGDYPRGPITDPAGPSSGSDRVLRGGSWNYAARDCRSADRGRDAPSIRSCDLGFRLALVPPSGR